jgi:hypothetical protein
MKNSPKSKYLLICVALFVLALAILFMFMLALGLPYTERPLHNFPFTTPTATPADFTQISRFSHHAGNPDLNIVITNQQGRA